MHHFLSVFGIISPSITDCNIDHSVAMDYAYYDGRYRLSPELARCPSPIVHRVYNNDSRPLRRSLPWPVHIAFTLPRHSLDGEADVKRRRRWSPAREAELSGVRGVSGRGMSQALSSPPKFYFQNFLILYNIAHLSDFSYRHNEDRQGRWDISHGSSHKQSG